VQATQEKSKGIKLRRLDPKHRLYGKVHSFHISVAPLQKSRPFEAGDARLTQWNVTEWNGRTAEI
jgi:hypothetical protein